MRDVLLTMSGIVPAGIEAAIARGDRPETDYLALARVIDAAVLDYAAARQQTGRWGKVLEAAGGPELVLAWACYRHRHRYRTILTDGEQVGIPLACLLKHAGCGGRPRHVMISHVLSRRKKLPFFDCLKIQTHIDAFVVYSTWQKRFIEKRWRVPPDRVKFTPFMVDARFFRSEPGGTPSFPASHRWARAPLICSAGLEFRDYPTLIDAVRGLEVQLVIAAASPWSKRSEFAAGLRPSSNVMVGRFLQFELRGLYAASRFVVIPLHPVQFQAGVSAILEAMAMGKAVICSRAAGQTDVIAQGETGLYVPPGDPRALRSAVAFLLTHPQEAERMGKNGRRFVEQTASLDRYAQRLHAFVGQAAR